MDDVKALVESAVACADDVSARIIDGSKRLTISDAEQMRNHIRRLAAALSARASSDAEKRDAALAEAAGVARSGYAFPEIGEAMATAILSLRTKASDHE